MADRVFEERLGLWIIDPANLGARLAAIHAFGGGIIRDLFLPRTATRDDLKRVRQSGLYAHLFVSPAELAAATFADRTLADIDRLGPGAADLNIELPADPPLAPFVRDVVMRIRARRPNYRLRLNLAPWKGFAAPADLLTHDPNLYAVEQNYGGNMDELYSPEDVAGDLRAWGVPPAKAGVCYAAHCRVLGSAERLRVLPDLSRIRRGVIFSDDLMADAGLL